MQPASYAETQEQGYALSPRDDVEPTHKLHVGSAVVSLASVARLAALFPKWRVNDDTAADDQNEDPPPPRAVAHGHMVHTSPRLVNDAMATRIRSQVATLVEAGQWTNRGAGLPTRDIYVRSLSADVCLFVARVLDACCGFITNATGDLVQCNEGEPPFIVSYEPAQQRGLARHKDGTESYTVLLAFDQPGLGFDGGGTRFHPLKRPAFTVTPPFGVALVFPQHIEHEGVPVARGKRRLRVAWPLHLAARAHGAALGSSASSSRRAT